MAKRDDIPKTDPSEIEGSSSGSISLTSSRATLNCDCCRKLTEQQTDSGSSPGTVRSSSTNQKPKRPGHGRMAASAYTGARVVICQHPDFILHALSVFAKEAVVKKLIGED